MLPIRVLKGEASFQYILIHQRCRSYQKGHCPLSGVLLDIQLDAVNVNAAFNEPNGDYSHRPWLSLKFPLIPEIH